MREVIIDRLRPKTSGIPARRYYLQSQQDLHIGGRAVRRRSISTR